MNSRYLGEWQIWECCYCQSKNYVYDYFSGDVTSGEDTEAIRCWKCGKASFVGDSDEMREMIIDLPDSPDECLGLKDGKEFPDG
jgi:hypothetical protein